MRPLLFTLDAETAHDLALSCAAQFSHHHWLANLLHAATVSPALQPITLAGMHFPNCVGLAAGLDKNARAPLAWWAFGFGFVELGTVTPRPQAGNPKPRMFRDPARRALLNRMGFNNDGAAAVAARLLKQEQSGRRPPFPIGISVGKNANTPLDQATEDYVSAAQQLAPHTDFISINVSSPNTSGLRSLQTEEQVRSLVRQVCTVTPKKPVFVKVAPELEGPALAGVVTASLSEGAAGLIATNTLARKDAQGHPLGGESGRPLQSLALLRVSQLRQLMGDSGVIIGVGGIDSIASARAMRDAGADLIQIYSALVYEGPFLANKLARGLQRRR